MKHIVRYSIEVAPHVARQLLDEWLRLFPSADLNISAGKGNRVSFRVEVDIHAGGVLDMQTRQFVAAVIRCQGMGKRLRYRNGDEACSEQ